MYSTIVRAECSCGSISSAAQTTPAPSIREHTTILAVEQGPAQSGVRIVTHGHACMMVHRKVLKTASTTKVPTPERTASPTIYHSPSAARISEVMQPTVCCQHRSNNGEREDPTGHSDGAGSQHKVAPNEEHHGEQ
jgi:hypothetical protein